MYDEFQAKGRALRDVKNRQPVEITYLLPTDEEILKLLRKKEEHLAEIHKAFQKKENP